MDYSITSITFYIHSYIITTSYICKTPSFHFFTFQTERPEKKLISDQQTIEGLGSSKINNLGTTSSLLKVERQSIGVSMRFVLLLFMLSYLFSEYI